MSRSLWNGRTLTLVALVALVLCWGSVLAFEQYSLDRNPDTDTPTDECADCHGNFRTSNESLSENTTWDDDLHDVHRRRMLDSNCNACHLGQTFPVILGQSDGVGDLSGFGCAGCHGRAADGTGTGTQGYGAGLRQHHWRNNVTRCADCHSDANPANKTPVAETILPPFYGSATAPSTPDDPCNPGPTFNESYAGLTQGLDNDGDNAYDGADNNCGTAPTGPGETAGEALDMLLVTGHDPVARRMSLSYGVACETSDNTLEFGDFADLPTYGYLGQVCGVGNTGTYDWVGYPAAPESLWFLIVGNDGAVEGSYGKNLLPDMTGTLVPGERPEDATSTDCPLPQNLDDRCDP